ncbi:MAG: S8 family serine peptidase [Anaerolineales bacterium]|nr:S8 family serine peptidase [Anaerolineales bacterium]
MKRFSALLVLALLVAITLSLLGPTTASSAADQVRVFVQFQPGRRGTVEQSLHGVGAQFHYAFDDLDAFVVSVPANALQGLSRNPNVVLVEEDAPRYPVATRASQGAAPAAAGSQVVPYGIDMVQARDVWDVDRDDVVDAGAPTGAGITVCIIDSGLYTGHEDLSGVSVSGYASAGDWNVDRNGHGTHVAGTITAMNNSLGVVGVLPGTANLYIVKVFGEGGEWVYASTLIDAANRCAANGARVISMSLSGTRASTTERRGFDKLYSQGVLSIAAASNDAGTSYAYPASYASVVSVAAIDETMLVADFSQQNDQVELAAPGVGVLSTVPYLDSSLLTVGGLDYAANHIEFSARGSASGALVNGGLCDSVGAWSGQIVLCERGVISFYEKVINVQNGGGAAVVIYNNAPGNFLGTLGEGSTSVIIGISLSQEDGQYLVANQLGSVASVTSEWIYPSNNYEYYDGTSMATPHVSAVAALIWSANPTATNAEIREALTATAFDLGPAGRDNAYGYGLVQAADALAYLGGGGPVEDTVHVADLDGSATWISSLYWKATVTIRVVDQDGVGVANAVVSVTWSGGYNASSTCTTDGAGLCSVTTGNIRKNKANVTLTVTAITASGFTYDPAANSDPDGDSNGTAITVLKP